MKNEIYEMGPHGLVRVDVPSNSVKNNLTPGTVLHWGGNMGFPSQDFAVIKRLQFERRDGEVYYDCLGLSTFEAHRVEGMHIKSETDPSVWHGQHFFLTPRVISGDEVLELIERNRVKVLADEATKAQADGAYSAETARLRALKNGLVRLDETNRNALTTAAKNIRKELAAVFPGARFSVTSSRYSGGDSIDIRWTDGPTSKAVEAITGKYSGGSFDGMIDLYTDEDTPWTAVYGSAKYVHESRDLSPAAVDSARRDVAKEMGIADVGPTTPTPDGWRPRFGWDLQQAARRCLWCMDLTAGYVSPANIVLVEGV